MKKRTRVLLELATSKFSLALSVNITTAQCNYLSLRSTNHSSNVIKTHSTPHVSSAADCVEFFYEFSVGVCVDSAHRVKCQKKSPSIERNFRTPIRLS